MKDKICKECKDYTKGMCFEDPKHCIFVGPSDKCHKIKEEKPKEEKK